MEISQFALCLIVHKKSKIIISYVLKSVQEKCAKHWFRWYLENRHEFLVTFYSYVNELLRTSVSIMKFNMHAHEILETFTVNFKFRIIDT